MVFIIIGILCIGYGIYVAIVRVKSPEKLGKYEAMKAKFGDIAGKILHIIFYTIVPMGFGTILIIRGLLLQ
jgi:Ni/Fe-hydrogenase subunit HybB-like protein